MPTPKHENMPEQTPEPGGDDRARRFTARAAAGLVVRLTLAGAALWAARANLSVFATLLVLGYTPFTGQTGGMPSRDGLALRVSTLLERCATIVALGVAPIILLLGSSPRLAEVVSGGVYAVAVAVRSFRRAPATPDESSKDLVVSGLPFAAGAGLALMPYLLDGQLAASPWARATGVPTAMVLAGIAMLYPAPVPIPAWGWRGWCSRWVLVPVAGAASGLGAGSVWIGVAAMTAAYLVLALAIRASGKERLPGWTTLRGGWRIVGTAATLVLPLLFAAALASRLALLPHAAERVAEESGPSNVPEPRPGLLLGFDGPLGADGVPAPWRFTPNRLVVGGRNSVLATPWGGQWQVQLATEQGSFALDRLIDADPALEWDLSWEWCATEFPVGGDVRTPSRDDQALQVAAYFDEKPVGADASIAKARGKTVLWVWDTTAPVGAVVPCGFEIGPFRYEYKVIVVRSGPSDGPSGAGAWVRERRNLAADYARCYPGPMPPLRGLRVQANSQHTKTRSAGAIRDLRLAPVQAENGLP